MGVERRHNNLYYYQKQRIGKRVISKYVGRHDFARLMHQADIIIQERRKAQQQAQRAKREKQAREQRAANDLERQCRELAKLALLAAGYHQHKGTWRKRREIDMSDTAVMTTNAPAVDMEAFYQLKKRCNKRDADPGDVRALRQMLPQLDMTEQAAANVRTAMAMHIQETYSKNDYLFHATHEYVTQQRRAMGYELSTAIERPLIDHVLLCELRLAHYEMFYSQAVEKGTTVQGMKPIDDLLAAAQRRYLRAVETLAKVRRMAIPVLVQQNITVN